MRLCSYLRLNYHVDYLLIKSFSCYFYSERDACNKLCSSYPKYITSSANCISKTHTPLKNYILDNDIDHRKLYF